MFHKSGYFDNAASPNEEFLIMSQNDIENLSDNIKNYSSEIEKMPLEELDEHKLNQLLHEYAFLNSDFITKYISKLKIK